MARIVLALGGNALGKDYLTQQKLIKEVAKNLLPLLNNNEIVITHGNGPQVGQIYNAFSSLNETLPLDLCTAMSEGYIGFHIQRELKEVLKENNITSDVVTLITDVLVDEKDPSFNKPTKPVGPFYTKEEAEEFMKNTSDIYIEDSGRGYRKVVASPIPKDISSINSIQTLLKNNTIVVCVGGGGVPVVKDISSTGVDAVIDKDLTSSLLARKLNADYFIILSSVDMVYINYRKDNQIALDKVNVSDLKKYINEGHFSPGSMLPKINACINFVENTNKEAYITSLDNLKNLFETNNKTIITK